LGETEERVIGASVNKQPTFEVRSLLVVGSAPLAVSLLSQSTFSFAIRHPPAQTLHTALSFTQDFPPRPLQWLARLLRRQHRELELVTTRISGRWYSFPDHPEPHLGAA